jgi:SAM-dependent methyltransferase
MLGQTLDYYLLRWLCHSRNRATNAELDRNQPPFDSTQSMSRLHKLISRLDGRFPLGPGLDYLDVGCGPGDLSLAILLAGGGRVTGVDIEERAIRRARHNAIQAGLETRSEFIHCDINTWTSNIAYDIVISHEALEHIHQPDTFLRRIGDFLKPNGLLVLAFGPLFHSPVGDHMEGFFQMPLPWRGVLFSEAAIMRLRRQMFRPEDPAARFEEVAGGLNRMRFSEFLTFAAAQYEFELLRVNPQLKHVPPLRALSEMATRAPVIKDYVATSVYAILKKRISFG